MKTCPECGIEIFFVGATECNKCGAQLNSESEDRGLSREEQTIAEDDWEISEENYYDDSSKDSSIHSEVNNTSFEEASKLQNMLEEEFSSAGDLASPDSIGEEALVTDTFSDSEEGSGNIKNDIDPVDAEKEKEDDKISTQSTIEHFSELVSSDTKTKISQ
ncbi:MAG: hypothetical protein GY855_09955, partial [candidate division Zixibacteria bacterium]|nr:hypothetical protein [candidate division Zixibacteria bacterium]